MVFGRKKKVVKENEDADKELNIGGTNDIIEKSNALIQEFSDLEKKFKQFHVSASLENLSNEQLNEIQSETDKYKNLSDRSFKIEQNLSNTSDQLEKHINAKNKLDNAYNHFVEIINSENDLNDIIGPESKKLLEKLKSNFDELLKNADVTALAETIGGLENETLKNYIMELMVNCMEIDLEETKQQEGGDGSDSSSSDDSDGSDGGDSSSSDEEEE